MFLVLCRFSVYNAPVVWSGYARSFFPFSDSEHVTCAQASVSKWHKLKIKCTVCLPPDDDSLNLHLKRTNYVAYCQIHYNLSEHPSPIGDGWEHLSPLPTQLTLQHYSDDCSSEDEISECGESTESDDE